MPKNAMKASGTAAAVAAPKLYEAANCVKLRTGKTGYRKKLGTLSSPIARRNTRISENSIPGALSGSVIRRSTAGHPDARRPASSRRPSTFVADAKVRSMVIGRNTDESTTTQPPNPNSQSDEAVPRRATTRLQPSAMKYGGNTNGTVSSHMRPERWGKSDFANKIPTGTPINPQTVVVVSANRMLLPNNGQKRAVEISSR